MKSLDALLQKYSMTDKNLILSAKNMVDAISKYSSISLKNFYYSYDIPDNFIMMTIKNGIRKVHINCYNNQEYYVSLIEFDGNNEFYWIVNSTLKENIEYIETYIGKM